MASKKMKIVMMCGHVPKEVMTFIKVTQITIMLKIYSNN